ncbi:MAG: hypothetical protein BIFFINMI_04285 [Phycisphaerae bacterium]|nr:hypothetical protein [Phycisphaerae bacterium]
MSQATFVQEGKRIDYTPVAAAATGQVVVQNSLIGIPHAPIAAGALGSLATEGVFDVVKATGAVNAGAAVYWDADGDPVGGTAGTGAATTTAEGNTFMGKATVAAGANDETVRVRLEGVATASNTIHEDLTNVIADPGDGEAIPVADSGTCQIVTGDAETRTLAAPADVGQLLALTMKTDGGNCVVTASAAVNAAGNNTLTFADVTDTILLIGAISGADKVWRVMGNDGVALSTV